MMSNGLLYLETSMHYFPSIHLATHGDITQDKVLKVPLIDPLLIK